MNSLKRLLQKRTAYKGLLVLAYILAVLGFSATARGEVGLNAAATQELFETQGQLVQVGDKFVLVLTPELSVFVESETDLTPFVGSWVHIVGFELNRRSGPVYHTAGRVDPLSQPMLLNVDSPVIVALEITSLSR